VMMIVNVLHELHVKLFEMVKMFVLLLQFNDLVIVVIMVKLSPENYNDRNHIYVVQEYSLLLLKQQVLLKTAILGLVMEYKDEQMQTVMQFI
jgi:hypothetical protein